jgi:hypothetical protein
MGPRGGNRNYTYSKITHINSQEGNVGPIKKIIENKYVNRKRGNSVPRAHVGTMGIYSIITKT